MVELFCNVKTNLDNAYFVEEEDDDFISWLDDALYKEVGDLEVEMETPDFENISKVKAVINQYFDVDHETNLDIEVETDLSEDEIADNDALFDFVEKKLMPEFIEQFNKKCQIIVPVTNTDTFDDFAFDGEEFYVKCYKGSNGYKAENVKTLTFQLTDDFEVGL